MKNPQQSASQQAKLSRLCIDGRAAAEYPERGLVSQELIDQLVAAQGEAEASSEWIEKRRTVLLSHPKQIFSGQLKRYDTNKGIGSGPLYWLWEREFIKKAHVSVFHRFRPIDRVMPASGNVPTLTTLLPPQKRLPFFLSRKPNYFYVVPSEHDRLLVHKQYHVPLEQLWHVKPGVRRYLAHTELPKPPVEGWILILTGEKTAKKELQQLRSVLSQRFNGVPHKVLSLKKRLDAAPIAWMKILSQTKLCLYLSDEPFDWATLALEAMYCSVPTIFSDGNHALSELLPETNLRLSRFLIELQELSDLKKAAASARQQLQQADVFEPFSAARHYRQIYQAIGIPTEVLDAPAPKDCC